MKLKALRKRIDRADRLMAKAFEMRMSAAEKIAAYKKENGMPIYDEKREKTVLENAAKNIKNKANSEDFREVVKTLTEISKHRQEKIINENKG